MKCINCGNELMENAKFCTSCGASQVQNTQPVNPVYQQAEPGTVIPNQPPMVSAPNYEQQTNSNVKTKSVPKLVYIIIGVVFVIIAANLFGGQSIDDIAVSCAKTVVSEQLKAPSSAIWHDCKVVDKDSYGRYLVYINVEATNSFGGYITNEYLVVVKDVKKSGEFSYNPNFAVQSVTSSTYDLVAEVTKDLNNWNEQT